MKCIEELKDVKLNNTAVTIGKFDGLHRGHGKLLNLLERSSGNRETVVLTFAEKPIDVINHTKSSLLMTEYEKRLLCEMYNMDNYISLPLTQEFLDLTPEAFIKDILIDILDMSLIVCGPDFTFGRFGAGNVELLKKMGKYYGYEVLVVEKEQYEDRDIGSTEIRSRILQGDIRSANEMLGHPYSVFGRVVEGKHLGRKLGMPTANLIPEANKILPPCGVYRTKLLVGKQSYHAVTNVGINPTVEENHQIKIETHIPGGEEDLYGRIIQVQFWEYLRPEQKFSSVEALKLQMDKDIQMVLRRFKEEESGQK